MTERREGMPGVYVAGAKIAAISYLPFGNVAGSSGTIDQRTYGAHPFDAEATLLHGEFDVLHEFNVCIQVQQRGEPAITLC